MTTTLPPSAAAALLRQERLNACWWLLDRRLDAGDGDRVAIRSGGVDHTYADVADAVHGVAAALRRDGVRPGERVLLVLPDGLPMVALLLGAMRVGAVPVPVSTMLTGSDLAFLAADCGARLAVVGEEYGAAAAMMAAGEHDLETIVVAGDPHAVAAPPRVAVHALNDWTVPGAPALPPRPTPADSAAFWLYTSGTTGRPKGAVHRHADLPYTAETYGAQVLAIRPDDRCYSVAKLFFAYGLGNSLTFPFSVGAATVLDPARLTPAHVAAAVVAERPTLFFATPTFYAALLAADLPPDTFASVRLGVSAGEPLPAPVYHRFLERFGVRILDGIGSTEALHIFISNRPDDVRPGTSGVPVPGYEARLVDDDGAAVPAGTPGHLLVRGDSVASGYWNRTAVTRRVFLGEWLRTGDVYTVSDDGWYTYCGRSDDMLKAGGIWVSPAEVESTLAEHPDVVEAAVVAQADDDGIERPVAFVVGRPGSAPTPEELVDFCRQRLAAFKRPRRVVLLDELPKTATGKIQRYRLRQRGG